MLPLVTAPLFVRKNVFFSALLPTSKTQTQNSENALEKRSKKREILRILRFAGIFESGFNKNFLSRADPHLRWTCLFFFFLVLG